MDDDSDFEKSENSDKNPDNQDKSKSFKIKIARLPEKSSGVNISDVKTNWYIIKDPSKKAKVLKKSFFSRELFNPYVAKTDKIIQQYDNLIKSYSIFISQKEYTKRDYFKITKSELLEKKVDRENIIKLISEIVKRVDWTESEKTIEKFEASKLELEGALPLAASISSKDLLHLILNLLHDLHDFYDKDGSEYIRRANNRFFKERNNDEDDDESYLWVLSSFDTTDDSSAAAA